MLQSDQFKEAPYETLLLEYKHFLEDCLVVKTLTIAPYISRYGSFCNIVMDDVFAFPLNI